MNSTCAIAALLALLDGHATGLARVVQKTRQGVFFDHATPTSHLAPATAAWAALTIAAAPASGVLTRAPAVVVAADPVYPPEAAASGLTAEVALELDLAATGEVTAARVLQPAGHGFDEAALEAARRLRFSPAEIDAKPAAVRLEYQFRFELKPPPPPAGDRVPDGGVAAPAPLRPVNLRGRVVERGSREPIAGAAVDLNGGAIVVATDPEGRFTAALSDGEVKVVVLEPAHARFETTETLLPGKVTEATYFLRRTSRDPFETVVVGQREKKDVATVALTASEINRVPGVSGDAVKVTQSLPSVARTMAGLGSELVVRGGSTRDTRIYVDGLQIPLAFHLQGVTSVYTSELLTAVELEPGNFGVRYGRATAGRLELKTRDPNRKQLHLLADANLFHATVLAEGPLTESVAIALAVRRSYVDGVLDAAAGLLPPDLPTIAVAPRYYDYQGKLVWRPGASDVLRLSVFGSDDRLSLVGVDTGALARSDTAVSIGFVALAASWDHRFSPETRLHVSVAESFIRADVVNGAAMRMKEAFDTTSIRVEGYHDLSERLAFGAGLDVPFMPSGRLQLAMPPFPRPGQVPAVAPDPVRADETIRQLEPAAWVEAVWKPVDRLRLVPGLRVDLARGLFDAWWVDPRLTARWQATSSTTLKGGVGLFHQPPEFFYTTSQWGNPDLHEEGAVQYGAGVEQRLFAGLTLDLQLYYKRMFGLASPSDRLVERGGEQVPERYASTGTGSAYGAELLVRYSAEGRFFGWLSYSLSRTRRDQQGGAFGAEGDAFDQPHNLVALGALELPELWTGLSLGVRARLTSGNPYQRNLGGVFDADADQYQPIPAQDARARLPAYFQLDLRLDKKWTFDLWTLAAYLEVQNLTNRANAESIAWSFDYSRSGYSTGLPIFPSFGVRADY